MDSGPQALLGGAPTFPGLVGEAVVEALRGVAVERRPGVEGEVLADAPQVVAAVDAVLAPFLAADVEDLLVLEVVEDLPRGLVEELVVELGLALEGLLDHAGDGQGVLAEHAQARSQEVGKPGHRPVSGLTQEKSIPVGGCIRPAETVAQPMERAKSRLLECRAMWPFWMPSAERARRAERFCARPTAAMVRARPTASGEPRTLRQTRANGCSRVTPPTVPTCRGRVRFASRSPRRPGCRRVRPR